MKPDKPKAYRPNPTDGMLRLARKIADRLGLTLTPEQEGNFEACRAFLDAHKDGVPPSDKQLAYAQRISEETGTPLSREDTSDFRRLSDWIDRHAPRR